MSTFVPILLAIGYGIVMFRLSSWRLSRELDDKSTELADPKLRALTAEMAKVVELPRIKVHRLQKWPKSSNYRASRSTSMRSSL